MNLVRMVEVGGRVFLCRSAAELCDQTASRNASRRQAKRAHVRTVLRWRHMFRSQKHPRRLSRDLRRLRRAHDWDAFLRALVGAVAWTVPKADFT